ncbi:vascular endothelial growth factor receptor 1, partial [Clarias magur]
IMDLCSQCFRTSILFQAFVLLPSCLCLSVRLSCQQTVYVVSGHSLVLSAVFGSEDHVTKVKWEHMAKGNSVKTTVAEYPAQSTTGRVTLDKGGAVMTLRNYQRTDTGVYTVTVRDQKGDQSSAQCSVNEYVAVHHVSVMVNVSHSILHCMEAWGTEPVFRWLHEKVAVTEAVGHVSPDGTTLHLTTALCGHFTCLVSNKLGHSSSTYTAAPCERGGQTSAVAVVCLILLLLLAGGFSYLLW